MAISWERIAPEDHNRKAREVLQSKGHVAESKCWNLQFDKFPTPASFLVWKTRFKTQVMMWIKRSGELKSSRSVSGKDFPDFEMLDAKIASAVNKIIQNSQFKKEGQPRGADSTKRGPVRERETNRPHDLRLLSSDCCSWHSVRLYWFILGYSSHWQRSGIRHEMGRSSVIDDKNSIRWIMGESAQN